jgi:hypothetical protein
MEETPIFRWISRSLSVICLLLGAFELFAVPVDALAVWHYLLAAHTEPVGNYRAQLEYSARFYSAYAIAHLFFAAIALGTARWAYRAGPSMQRFFNAETR